MAENLDVDVRFVTLVELGATPEVSGEDHLQRVLQRFVERESGARLVTTEVARGNTLEEAVTGLDWRPEELALGRLLGRVVTGPVFEARWLPSAHLHSAAMHPQCEFHMRQSLR